MKTSYLVMKGFGYIVGVFTTKENAEDFMSISQHNDILNSGEYWSYYLQKLPLDPLIEKQRDLCVFICDYDFNNNKWTVKKYVNTQELIDELEEKDVIDIVKERIITYVENIEYYYKCPECYWSQNSFITLDKVKEYLPKSMSIRCPICKKKIVLTNVLADKKELLESLKKNFKLK